MNENRPATVPGPSGSPQLASLKQTVIAPLHALTPGVYAARDGANWVVATSDHPHAVGIVETVRANTFTLVTRGLVRLPEINLVPGLTYYRAANGSLSPIPTAYGPVVIAINEHAAIVDNAVAESSQRIFTAQEAHGLAWGNVAVWDAMAGWRAPANAQEAFTALRGIVAQETTTDVVIVVIEGAARLPAPLGTINALYVLDPGAPTTLVTLNSLDLVTYPRDAKCGLCIHRSGGDVSVLPSFAGFDHEHTMTGLLDWDPTLPAYPTGRPSFATKSGASGWTIGRVDVPVNLGTVPATSKKVWREDAGSWVPAAVADIDANTPLAYFPAPSFGDPVENAVGTLEGFFTRAIDTATPIIYYLDPASAGDLTATRPTSGLIRAVGILGPHRRGWWFGGRPGPALRVEDLTDVNIAARADGTMMVWSDSEEKYVHVEPEAAALGTRAALSVIGNPTAAAAAPVDIAAGTDDRIFGRSGNVLGFFQIKTAMIEDDAVTADKLADTAVTPGSYGAGTLVPNFSVDQQGRLTGAGNFTPSIAGDVTGNIGASVVAKIQGRDVSAATPNNKDFLVYISGSWTYQQVLSTRGDLFIRGATETQALPIGSDGYVLATNGLDPFWTPTLKLGTSAAGGGTLTVWHEASKSFNIEADGTVRIANGDYLYWGSVAHMFAGDISGNGYMTLNAGGFHTISMSSQTISIGGSTNASAFMNFGGSGNGRIHYTFDSGIEGLSGNYGVFRVNGKVRLGSSNSTLGFFGSDGATKTAVADMGALVTTETADSTYSANEVSMLNNLKADVTSLRTKLNQLLDALQSYNQV